MNPYFPQEPANNALALLFPEILETDLFQQPDDPLALSLPVYPEISDDIFQEHILAASFSAYPNISDPTTDCFQQPDNTLVVSRPKISDPITDISPENNAPPASFPVSDPVRDFSLFPGPLPSNAEDTVPCYCGPLSTMAISKSESICDNHYTYADTGFIAVRARQLPPHLAGSSDLTLSFSTEVQAPARKSIRLPVVSLGSRPSPTHQTPQPGPSRAQKNRGSPYPRGKDKSQRRGSRPSDVGHKAQTIQSAKRSHGRYLISVLSIIRH